MARSIWSGALTFGLVNIPVKLFTAVSRKDVHFHMLHDKDGARIQVKRFCSAEDVEVPYEHVVKGFEVAPQRYVTVTREELEAYDPKATRTVEIHDFVELSEIDPVYFEANYWLVPDRTAAKAYALLADAMRRAGKVGIATAVLRTKESLCCVRPSGEVLALTTMNRADEIVPATSLDFPEAGRPAEKELAMAEQLVASLTGPFEPERYPDVRRQRILELVQKKAEGEAIEAPAPEQAPAQVVSLADALAASLAAARGAPTGKAAALPKVAASQRGARRHAPAAAARTAGKRPSRRRG